MMTDLTDFNSSFFLDSLTPPMAGEKYLTFFLDDGELYAVSSKQVTEVAPMPGPIAFLPNAPGWLIGIVNLRGEVVCVVSLPTLLNKPASIVSSKPKLVCLRPQNSDVSFAFMADRLSELIVLPNAEIQFGEDRKSPYIFGKAVHQSNDLTLINTEKFLSSLII